MSRLAKPYLPPRFFTFSGHVPVDISHFELDELEINMINALGAKHPFSCLPAFYNLYLLQVCLINELRGLAVVRN